MYTCICKRIHLIRPISQGQWTMAISHADIHFVQSRNLLLEDVLFIYLFNLQLHTKL